MRLSILPAALLAAAPALAQDDALSYEPYPLAQITDEIRYPGAQPPAGTVSRHGEVEYLGNNVFGLHWFVEANGAVWHFVTAGDPSDEVILLVHGYPDTWWSWAEVMTHLADDYYVIAVDTLGYGQSDKRLDLDLTYAGVAEGLEALLDVLGVGTFNLVGHDRGAVIADHMVARDSLNPRILAYLRMQQSASEPHGLPRPPHEEMATVDFHDAQGLYALFESEYYTVEIPADHQDRAVWEFGFPGTAEAAAQQFSSAGFDAELDHRLSDVFPRMTMPVVFLQGAHDPGQRPEEYFATAAMVPNGEVIIIDAGHFPQAEYPDVVAGIADDLFD